MNCSNCGNEMELKSPDYGRGSEWACYGCSPYGERYSSREFTGAAAIEANTEQADSKTLSRLNAKLLKETGMKTEAIDPNLLKDVRREVLHKACNLIAVIPTPDMVKLGSKDYNNGFQIGLLTAIACIAKIEP